MPIPERPEGRRQWQTDREWARLNARIATVDTSPAQRTFTWRPIAAIAACIIVAATALFVARHRIGSTPSPQIVTTTAGQRIVVRLGDSSTITLAPATTARITRSDSRRVVELDGMADFHVTHDSAHPFIVRTRGTQTTDIGTEFTVRAYASDSSVRVAVTSGVVSLAEASNPGAALTLNAGDVGIAAPGRPPVREATDARAIASWVDGGLSFRNEPLSAVALELNRWFDVDIRIATPALAERRVSAVYHDPTLSGVIDALSATLGIRAVRNGRVVTLYPADR